jgi:hypothetical protein
MDVQRIVLYGVVIGLIAYFIYARYVKKTQAPAVSVVESPKVEKPASVCEIQPQDEDKEE